jgi:hypothetical protein
MKTFMIFVALGFACYLVIGCSDKPPATVGQAGQTDSEKNPAAVATADQSEAQTQAQPASDPTEVAEIDGRLIQTEKGMAVVTDTDAYVVAGRDLSDMLGKMVKVTGTVAEVDGGQVIDVMTVTPVE